MARKINKAGIDLVKSFEGFYAGAYVCPAGVWTIGYGHTKGVKKGDKVTLDEAEALLDADLAEAAAEVARLVTVPLKDNQFAALASFVFNLGASSLKSSTLLKKLNAGNYDDVPAEMSRWVKATDPKTGQKRALAGLVRRRAAEGELWLAAEKSKFVNTNAMPQLVTR
jgi:lysozyme